MAQQRPPGVLSRQLIFSLYVPATLLALGQSMVAPVIPVLTTAYGVSIAEASLVFVAFSLGSVVVTVPAGYLMDRIGRRPVLLAGPLLAAVGSFMTPFSHSFLELLFWRFLVGMADQMWQQGRLIVIADTAPANQRARQMQWLTGMTRFGHLIGPSLGGLLAAGFAVWVPFVLHAIITIIAVIPSFILVKESAPSRHPRDPKSNAAPSAEGWRPVLAYMLTFQVLAFLVVQIAAQLSRGGHEHGSLNLYAVYAFGMGPGALGLLNTFAVAFAMPVPFLSGYLMDRFGRRAVIAPGFGIYAIALVIMSLTAFFPLPMTVFLVSYVLVLAAQGTTSGTMQVLGSDLSPPVNRGRFFALWRMIAQMAAAVSPAGYAFVSEFLGYGFGFLYLSACALAVVMVVTRVLGDTQDRADRVDRGQAG